MSERDDEVVVEREVVHPDGTVDEEYVVVHENPRGEWIKFGVLAAIMVGTILVMLLLLPYIFGTVVPAVIGDGLDPIPTLTPYPVDQAESESGGESGETAVDSGSNENVEEAGSGEESADSQMGGGAPAAEEGSEEEAGSSEGESEGSSDDEASGRTYTVKRGDTLFDIAKAHGTTIEAIAAANDLTNLNNIQPGDVLTIP